MVCSQPWMEMVLSPPDNRVTCCCDYHGDGATLLDASQDLRHIAELWNAPEARLVRRLQSEARPDAHGCAGCPRFQDSLRVSELSVFDEYALDAITESQRHNLALAKQDYAEKREYARARPVKYKLFFGWGCNITCRTCNQVPFRNQMKTKLAPKAYEAMRDQLADAVVVECLGGEPFALPTGLEFMRDFAADQDMAHVRLMITTNATLLHKHIDWLMAKERITFNVSIDSVGEGYESIRVGGSWQVVEANLRTIQGLVRGERPNWRLNVNAVITLTGIRHLPAYARFMAETGISSRFEPLKIIRGIEETVYQEDVLEHPYLLDTLPDWQTRMAEAIDILTQAGMQQDADVLTRYATQLRGANVPAASGTEPRVLASVAGPDVLRMVIGQVGGGVVLDGSTFNAATINDGAVIGINFFGTLPADGRVLLRLSWEKSRLSRRHLACHAVLVPQPDFFLSDWREGGDDLTLVKDVEATVIGDPMAPRRLLLSLMAAKVGYVALLPDRIEVMSRAA